MHGSLDDIYSSSLLVTYTCLIVSIIERPVEVDASYSPLECSDVDPATDEFVALLKSNQFCEVDAACRSGSSCHPGKPSEARVY
jgi:hypothetical protein